MTTLQCYVPVATDLAANGMPADAVEYAHEAALRRLAPNQRIVGEPMTSAVPLPLDLGTHVIGADDGITCFRFEYAVESLADDTAAR